MKNDKMKQALERELSGVHVSGALKRRILAEAAESRAPQKKAGWSIRPLAIAAAVMVTIGLSAGLIALRAEKPDLSATPLSQNSNSDSVWVWKGVDGRYHGKNDCGGQQDMSRAKIENARAEGLKACSKCFEEDAKAVEDLVWAEQSGAVYHAQRDCSGMENPMGILEIEAKTLGLMECGLCMDGETIESWPEYEDAMPTPMPTQDPGSFRTLPYYEQGEVVYVETTPEPTVQPSATLTPMPTAAPTMDPQVESTPEPTPMPAPEANAEDETLVWGTGYGEFYHADEHCSGMENASAMTEIEALLCDLKPCEICMERTLWTADCGLSYHLAKNCGDMEGATAVTMLPGDSSCQVGCLVCAAGGIPVWTTENGALYHWDEHCSGMINAKQIMQSEALAVHKQMCSICFGTHSVDGATVVFSTEDENDEIVWIKCEDGAIYYHSDEFCANYLTVAEARSSMKTACEICGAEGLDDVARVWFDTDKHYHAEQYCSERTKAEACDIVAAEAQGRKPCVLCIGQEEYYQNGNVWFTENGMFYHTQEHCSGMENAHAAEVTEALAVGMEPCPTCTKQFSEVWAAESGAYYHLDAECSGLEGASKLTGSEAAQRGLRLCPQCKNELMKALAE